MRSGDIGRQHAQYRRGLVLGFTVAETLLLVLFALMLALGFVLMKRDRELKTLTGEISQLREKQRFLATKLEVFQAMAQNKPTDEFFRELVRARALQADLAARAAQLAEREKATSKLETVIDAVKGRPDARRRVVELAALGARVQGEIDRLSPQAAKGDAFALVPQAVALAQASLAAGRSLGEARAALTDSEKGARENATLKGQIVTLHRDLASIGRGGDFPPCWVTAGGEIQFLLRVTLNGGDTLSVVDITPPARLDDRRALPLGEALFAGPVSRGRFLAETQGLYDQSRAKGCRYYVVVSDRTGATQKELFKTLLFTVEAHFYKVILRS
jgi:sulfur transfer complex TusBCD TusB component (DsrH family)